MALNTPTKRKKNAQEPLGNIVYIHGIGWKPPKEEIKLKWDIALFGKDMGARTRMAYWADLRPAERPSAERVRGFTEEDSYLDLEDIFRQEGIQPDDDTRRLMYGIASRYAWPLEPFGPRVLPLPGFMRRPITRFLLKAFIKDTAAYFFKPNLRQRMLDRLKTELTAIEGPITLVGHSQGTMMAYELLAAEPEIADIGHFITLGSPLGIQEIQDLLKPPGLKVPANVEAWTNFSDPWDYVSLDNRLGNDFQGPPVIKDHLIKNVVGRRLRTFNPHEAVGYLAHPKVREVVYEAARIDPRERFVVARDVAEGLEYEGRQPVLIEVLEPGRNRENEPVRSSDVSMTKRIAKLAKEVERLVPEGQLEDARVERLKRYVAAHLTPEEITQLTVSHESLKIRSLWKNSTKRTNSSQPASVVQVDAARNSYRAFGEGICWAVLDTGVNTDHPHFATHTTIEAVYDCTRTGPPVRLTSDTDRNGHGSHVAGIVAGAAKDGSIHGMAERAKLIVYKVLKDNGSGEDAWIIKALDHIAELNANRTGLRVHGINLSLGGPYDPTVYGCGFTPLCAELRRQWRDGVLVCVSSGNEGTRTVLTPDGEEELNFALSIGDPANLEECIAVGSVHAERPHLYGVSSFSSKGPTSDGRLKPDVVAPGERILSCNSRFKASQPDTYYREDSGTSMSAPHVSGLLAAFLSVRREFIGRPDEVKALLLRTCTDLKRERYHQGHGLPNLMRMLLEV